MPTALAWNAETPELFTTVVRDLKEQPTVHLVAEAVRSGGWDWTAWTNHGIQKSLQGKADSRVSAMKSAELAACMILVARVLQAA